MNLCDSEIKLKILLLCKKYNLTSTKELPICSDQNLHQIESRGYCMYLRYFGTRSIVVFTIIDGVHYKVNFPKFMLTNFKNNSLVTDNFVLYPLDVKVSSKLYENTILEVIYCESNPNKKLFSVEDVFCVSGRALDNLNKFERLKVLDRETRIEQGIISNLNMPNLRSLSYEWCVRTYTTILNPELPKVKELIFISPQDSMIFSCKIRREDLIQESLETQTYLMRKHPDKFDVYFLYEPSKKSNLTQNDFNKMEKIGIARIDKSVTSKMCHEWFADGSVAKIVNCKKVMFDNRVKWIPLALVA